MPAASPRLRGLDGLRGIAAVVVVVHHSLLVVPPLAAAYWGTPPPPGLAWLVDSPVHLLWGGTEAVWIFFILSGLVLVRPSALGARPSWRAYYPSRLLRLYPPVAGAVALALLIATVFPRVAAPGQSVWLAVHDGTPAWSWVASDLLLVAPPDLHLDSPLWSLQWEVLFSLLLPLVVWLAARCARRAIPAALIALALCTLGSLLALHADDDTARTIAGVPFYLPMFVLGGLLAVRLPGAQQAVARLPRAAVLLLTAVALVGLTLPWTLALTPQDVAARLLTPLVLTSAVGLVVLAASPGPMSRLLQRRPLQWLGRISFSLYLTHEPIVVTVGQLLPPGMRWLTLLIALPIALVVAWVFFRLVEGPAHRLSERLRSAAAPPPAASLRPVRQAR